MKQTLFVYKRRIIIDKFTFIDTPKCLKVSTEGKCMKKKNLLHFIMMQLIRYVVTNLHFTEKHTKHLIFLKGPIPSLK